MSLEILAERNVYSMEEKFSTHRLMAREFRALGCEVKRLEAFTVVTYGGKSCFLLETETSFTSILAYRILKDKELAKAVFLRSGLTVAEGQAFSKNDKQAALEWLRKISPAVVKPVDGNRGRGVSVNVSADTFDLAWAVAAEYASDKILIERFVHGAREARYLVVDSRCIAVMIRLPPTVVGDGDATVETLVARQNEIRRHNPNLRHCLIELDAHRQNILATQGLTTSSIPAAGTVVRIDWKSGLSTGGEPMDVTASVHESMKQIAERVSRAIPGADVVGVDILARDHSLPADDNGYVILEANTRPGIGGHIYPMYGKPINVCRAIAEYCMKRMGSDAATEREVDLPAIDIRSAGEALSVSGQARRTASSAMVVAAEPVADDMTIVIAGDTSLGDAYLSKQADASQRDRLEANPLSFFEGLTPLISDKSRLLLNLETVLATSIPAGPLDGLKSYLGWDNAERTTGVLRAIGTDAVSLANNHSMDYGAGGLLESLAHLRLANIATIGAGESARHAAQPLTWTCGDLNIHVLAGFEARRKYRDVYGFYATEARPGVSSLSASDGQPSMSSRIRNLRSSDPAALIVVFPHWGGSANYQWAAAKMSELSSSFTRAGADLVVGHGSHVMQQLLVGSSGTTAFSLGNFVFNSPGRYRQHGAPPYSIVCRLRVKQAGSALSATLRLYPTFSDNRETGYRPRPVTESEAITLYRLLARTCDESFTQAFQLSRDERGWCLVLSAAVSPRLGNSS